MLTRCGPRSPTASFTNGADMAVVADLYSRTLLGTATTLRYVRLGWGDAEASALADALRETRCEQLVALALGDNEIGDRGAAALAAAFASGALPRCEVVWLWNNEIDDDGARALADAVAAGALPQCKKLVLTNKQQRVQLVRRGGVAARGQLSTDAHTRAMSGGFQTVRAACRAESNSMYWRVSHVHTYGFACVLL
jgi:hypothetical protein